MEFFAFLIVLFILIVPLWALIRTYMVTGLLEQYQKKETARLEALISGLKKTIDEIQASKEAPSVPVNETPVTAVSADTVMSVSIAAESVRVETPVAETAAFAAVTPAPVSVAVPAVEPEPVEMPRPVPSRPEPKPAGLFAQWKESLSQFARKVDWEQFTGVKLFAWLGAVALFCGAGFFVKYSIDNNLIHPSVRLALGGLAGLGLVVWSLFIDRKKYKVTSWILASGGIGVLYMVVYAAANIYGFIPGIAGFILLALVSGCAFVLSVYLDGVTISALGAVGAFAVPVLISAGSNDLVVLFAYLSLVNIGIFEVVRRLKSAPLFLLSALATVVLLLLAMKEPVVWRNAWTVTGVAMGNLALFTVFLLRLNPQTAAKKEAGAAGVFVFAGNIVLMFALIAHGGVYSMVLAVFATALAVLISYFRVEWKNHALFYCILTFVVTLLWVLSGYESARNSADYALFFLYGAAGGLGPVLIVRKYGLEKISIAWFRVFPLLAMVLTTVMVIQHPETSSWFWPMLLGLNCIGMFICFIIGSAFTLITLTALTVLDAVIFISRVPLFAGGFSFYAGLLVFGLLLCLAAVLLFSWLPSLMTSSLLGPFKSRALTVEGKKAEWLSAAPALGVFVILGTAFIVQSPLQPNEGMATGLFFLTVSLFLGFRISSAPVMIVSLLSFLAAQTCWMAFVAPGSGLETVMWIWSAALWTASLAVPLIFFRPAEKHASVWQAWSLFSLVQSLYLIRSSNMLFERSVTGLIVVALFAITLPVVAYLLKTLEGKAERNKVIAFHGGVLIFYLSSVAVLLLHKEWLGLTLVFEAMGLLWLNRRVRHPLLPLVAALMSPAGLAVLIGNLNELRGAGDPAIVNPASLSLASAVAALFVSVALAPKEKIKKIPAVYTTVFMWLAVGAGFFLVNFFVADWFHLQSGETYLRFGIFSGADMFRFVSYSLLWTVFGAALWSAGMLPKGLRVVGLLLLAAGWVRVLILPYLFDVRTTGIILPVLAVFAVLMIREKSGSGKSGMKQAFIAVFSVSALYFLTVAGHDILQPSMPFRLLFGHSMNMAFVSASGWILYGSALCLWPGRLARPFRLAGMALILPGLAKTLVLPFVYAVPFGVPAGIVTLPNVLLALYLPLLVFLTLKNHGDRWPLGGRIPSRSFWGVILAVYAFSVLNVAVAKYFGEPGTSFTLSTSGRFSQQLAYSLGWLAYSMTLLWVGIHWKSGRTRYASLALTALTGAKIFVLDVWRLDSLYRVASFIVLAAVLILVSFLYQKFLTRSNS